MENCYKPSYPFLKTEEEIRADKNFLCSPQFENHQFTYADLGVHYQYRARVYLSLGGDSFTLCSSTVPVSSYLGELLTFLGHFFELTEHDYFKPEMLKGEYLRLVLDGEYIVGFGHIIKDQFVWLDDIFGPNSKLRR